MKKEKLLKDFIEQKEDELYILELREGYSQRRNLEVKDKRFEQLIGKIQKQIREKKKFIDYLKEKQNE